MNELTAPSVESPTRRWLPSGRMATVLLLGLYVALSFVNDLGGYLGTDTGGKVGTLHEMAERGSPTDLDIGYWAEEWDREGTLHPHFGTQRIGPGWIQVTTVPMVVVGYPLYSSGGYRLVLLLPMLGGLACATAARRLARLFGASEDGRSLAFWLVGLSGSVVVYSLDFWEHTIGLGAMAWATIRLWEAEGQPTVRRLLGGLVAGLLWGLAFSMRTESLVYAAVMTAALLLHLGFVRRRLREAVETGAATAVGLLAAIASSVVLERAVLGASLRTGRAEDTATGVGSEVAVRLREGLVTTFGFGAGDVGLVFGLLVFGLLATAVWATSRGRVVSERWPMLAVGALVPAVLYLSISFGFVSGLFMTAPVAIAGVVLGRRGPGAPVVWGAIIALPIVWAFQYLGGAGPQWGGRYTLMSGLVLTVAGVRALPSIDRVVRGVLLFGSVAITVFGLAWMSVRTHQVADAGRQFRDRGDQVVVTSRVAGFLPREFLPAISERRWLRTVDEGDLVRASEVVTSAGDRNFSVIYPEGTVPEERIGSYRRTSEENVPYILGVRLIIVTYER